MTVTVRSLTEQKAQDALQALLDYGRSREAELVGLLSSAIALMQIPTDQIDSDARELFVRAAKNAVRTELTIDAG